MPASLAQKLRILEGQLRRAAQLTGYARTLDPLPWRRRGHGHYPRRQYDVTLLFARDHAELERLARLPQSLRRAMAACSGSPGRRAAPRRRVRRRRDTLWPVMAALGWGPVQHCAGRDVVGFAGGPARRLGQVHKQDARSGVADANLCAGRRIAHVRWQAQRESSPLAGDAAALGGDRPAHALGEGTGAKPCPRDVRGQVARQADKAVEDKAGLVGYPGGRVRRAGSARRLPSRWRAVGAGISCAVTSMGVSGGEYLSAFESKLVRIPPRARSVTPGRQPIWNCHLEVAEPSLTRGSISAIAPSSVCT